MIPNKEVHIEKSRDLLKRGKKGLLHLVFSRTGIMALLVLLQLGLMLLFYILCGIDNTTVLTTIAAVAGGAGPLEALAAAIITPPILTALWRIRR